LLSIRVGIQWIPNPNTNPNHKPDLLALILTLCAVQSAECSRLGWLGHYNDCANSRHGDAVNGI